MIKLYGKPIRVNKASKDKKSVGVGANLVVGNLDPDVEEKLLYETFSAFGVIGTNPKIMRDPETGNSHGFGFLSYDSFEASDAAIEAMNGQYLCNLQVIVSYAYKKDTKGESVMAHQQREFWPQAIPVSRKAGLILYLLVDLLTDQSASSKCLCSSPASTTAFCKWCCSSTTSSGCTTSLATAATPSAFYGWTPQHYNISMPPPPPPSN